MKKGDLCLCSFRDKPCTGFVYNEYTGGVCVILRDGTDMGGFNEDEIQKYLTYICHTGYDYTFTNVIQLDRDYNAGEFSTVFSI